ncbi:MAG: hypothetical protein WBB07_02235 [Mycobacterium sp.]
MTSLTAAAVCSVALVAGPVTARAAPAFDSQGYTNSTARCASAAEVVVFGSTGASRVAICDTADGLQYRGVRVRDGARLVVPASKKADGEYAATTDGITYTVTSSALKISSGSSTIRTEPMTDFHATSTDTPASTSTPTTTTSTPTPTTTTSVDPNLPPLPAEVGGSGS